MVEDATIVFGRPDYKRSFPRLIHSSYVDITSPKDPRYNCIAWAAEDTTRRWWPRDRWSYPPSRSIYWPEEAECSTLPCAFVQAYQTIGYQLCSDGTLEEGITKIALYAKEKESIKQATHASRQLPCGKWTSKLGDLFDITHASVLDLEGPCYGKVVCYLSRSQ